MSDQSVTSPVADGGAVNLNPADIMADVRKRSLVQRVCHAYESGYGRGESGRDLSQPYVADCEEGIAYVLGWYQGRSRRTP